MTNYTEIVVHLVAAGNVFGNITLRTVILSRYIWAANRNLTISDPENFPIYLVCLALVVICQMAHHAK